jgi:hypothetical protein
MLLDVNSLASNRSTECSDSRSTAIPCCTCIEGFFTVPYVVGQTIDTLYDVTAVSCDKCNTEGIIRVNKHLGVVTVEVMTIKRVSPEFLNITIDRVAL